MDLLVVGTPATRNERICERLKDLPGYRVRSAADVEEACACIAEGVPQLVIALHDDTDPLLSQLEPRDDFPRFPLLVLLECDDTPATVGAFRAGAIDVLVESPDVIARLPRILPAVFKEWQRRRDRHLAHDYAARFGNILASSMIEIYTIDAETLRFIRVNRGARRNLGYSKRELSGMTPLDLRPLADREQLEEKVRPLRSGERETIRFETELTRKDGTRYPVDIQLQLVDLEQPVFIAVALDISERKRALERLQASEARFRSIFNTAAAGIAILSPHGDFLEVNPFFCEFTGYPADELVGMRVVDVTHPDDRDMTFDYFSSLRQGGDPVVNIEKRYLRKDGQVRWGHASVACVIGTEQGRDYCIGLVQDITGLKEAEAKMQDALAELDAFAHTVAHDLRTPLTPIIGMAEFLQSHAAETLDQVALSFLADIENSGHRMLALLEDLLSLARVGHVPQPSAPVDTRRVVDEVLANLAFKLAEARVRVEIGDLSPLCIPESLVSQVFDNLIGNAVRYAAIPGEPIEIGETVDENRVRIYVRDHGPGIPEDEVGHIFEVFFRGERARASRGTGIGLATVRKIARLHSGDARVEETPGGGSTFIVELPLAVLSCPVDERSAC